MPLEAFWRPQELKLLEHFETIKTFKSFKSRGLWEMLWLASGGQKAQITLYIKVSLTYLSIYIYICATPRVIHTLGPSGQIFSVESLGLELSIWMSF